MEYRESIRRSIALSRQSFALSLAHDEERSDQQPSDLEDFFPLKAMESLEIDVVADTSEKVVSETV